MAAKARMFHIVSKTHNPETGEQYLCEAKIKEALAHRTIKRWGYVLHDKDIWTEADELDDPKHVAGEHKDDHFHIALEMKSNLADVDTIAKWFGIPSNFIEIGKGRGAFLDIMEYLTHENPKECAPVEEGGHGKHLYDDDEITASFDFRAELNKRKADKLKYGTDLDKKQQQRYDVLYNGKSLLQCQADDAVLYMEDYKELKNLRMQYLSQLPPPPLRINFYVQGRGGVGKGLMCRALARSLCPEFEDDSEIFFEVGAPGAAFEGYDGQPVIIWNDRRHGTLLKELKGRENVFNVFDTHPTRQKQNIKFGSVALCNRVNIVNSVEPYEEFLDGFVGKFKNENGEWEQEEDKGQSYRRFPFIMPLREEDFDIYLNKGFMYGTSDFLEYEKYEHIRGNMQRIAEACRGNERLVKQLNGQVLQPVLRLWDKMQEQFAEVPEMSEQDEAAILQQFASYGKPMPSLDNCIIYKGKVYPMGAVSADTHFINAEDVEAWRNSNGEQMSIDEVLEGIEPFDSVEDFIEFCNSDFVVDNKKPEGSELPFG